ncbi:DnaJ-like subfamily B member 12 [Spatholobus suberectus]|nr:DnaJ-like subfamily B member 12 [Spatholobus suberectus]
MQSATRAEAERLLGIAEKLLQNRDLMGSREFAILAQETEPLLEGSDQILAIVDVLLAADKRVNNHPDWYAVLQVDRRSDDLDLIKKQYRRLALLLHPDKSRFHFADHAFKLVADAWALLSDPVKKAVYDKELSFFSRVDLSVPGWVQQEKLPVRRTGPGPGPSARNSAAARDEIHAEENSRRRNSTFWTACPYCYRLYEYPRALRGLLLAVPELREVLSRRGRSVPPAAGAGSGRVLLLLGVLPHGLRSRQLRFPGEGGCSTAAAGFFAAELDAGAGGEWRGECPGGGGDDDDDAGGCGEGDSVGGGGGGGYFERGWFGVGDWAEEAREAEEVSFAIVRWGLDWM